MTPRYSPYDILVTFNHTYREVLIMARESVIIRMVGIAAGPSGVLHIGKYYRVSEAKAKELCTPHPETGDITAYRQNTSLLAEDTMIEDGPDYDSESKDVPPLQTSDIIPEAAGTTPAPKAPVVPPGK
jgi:hypothetical protein